MGTEQYAIVRVAEALAAAGIKLVPEILVNGKDGNGNGLIDALIGSEMLKKLQKENETVINVRPDEERPTEEK
jgi:hypothetical protein